MFSEKDLLFPLSDQPLIPPDSGGFARRVLVLSTEDTGTHPMRPFLQKVLSAVQIDLEKDTLYAEYKDKTNIPVMPVFKSKQPETVLVFGLQPQQLCLALKPSFYQPLDFYGATWLWADALATIEHDKDKKTLLWRALQVMFR